MFPLITSINQYTHIHKTVDVKLMSHYLGLTDSGGNPNFTEGLIGKFPRNIWSVRYLKEFFSTDLKRAENEWMGVFPLFRDGNKYWNHCSDNPIRYKDTIQIPWSVVLKTTVYFDYNLFSNFKFSAARNRRSPRAAYPGIFFLYLFIDTSYSCRRWPTNPEINIILFSYW